MKRMLDILGAAAGLVILAPFLPLIALAIKLDTPGPLFFRQERVGRGFRPFRVLKFRTMVADAAARGPVITGAGDPRVTRVGALLRRAKLDELPQLINVLAGEMSLVGPRPEVARYVELFRPDYQRLLAVRPGITDPASLRYAREEALLPPGPEQERVYVREILPRKIALSLAYLEKRSLAGDLALIIRTMLGIHS